MLQWVYSYSLTGDGSKTHSLWNVKTRSPVRDIVTDTTHSCMWIVSGGMLGQPYTVHQYTMDGRYVKTVGKGLVDRKIRRCIDIRMGCLVLSGDQSLLCMDREGGKVRETRVPGAGYLRGVVYCEERDVYVVGDVGVRCLWYIDAGSGTVVRQVGSEGSGEGQFRWPHYLCHHHVSEGECHIYVGDNHNHCISVYTASGDYIRRFGSQGSGDRQLSYPWGVCVDGSGRVVVCDRGNKRVVRYWWERDVEQWDVILPPQQLGGEYPGCVDITDDGHMVIGTIGTFLTASLLCFPYKK